MDIKYLFKEQIILTVLIIFVILYVIVNFNNICNGSMFGTNNNIRKPLLLALIISLLGYLFVTWDNNSYSEEIPKYKIVNNRNTNIDDQPIIIDLPPYKFSGNNNFKNDFKNDNESIFMSQKQANARYGLKF